MTERRKRLTRQEFLRLMAATTGSAALASCTAAPAQVEPTTAPTTAAIAAPTVAPTAPSAETPKLGAHLIGELEGYEIIRDPGAIPATFNEAPMLAEMVQAGTLPPVKDRLPEEPLVVKPVHEIGKYGGTLRRGFTGPGDGENGNRLMAVDKFIFWDFTGTKVQPSVAKDWKVSEDGKTITLYLRKGHKWSDGQPFTADDVMFWFEDIYQNPELVPTPLAEMTINGQPGKIVKIDDSTVAFEFPEPYYLFEHVLAGDMWAGRGQTTGQFGGRFFGGYAPAHYLKDYLPKYVSEEELAKKATDAGFDTWLNLLKFKIDWQKNPELPVLAPWKVTSPITESTWVMERNPYYYEVDTAGNQLPYIDKIVMTLAEDLEVLNLRAIAGEIDYQARHIDIQKLPVFLENQQKGDYTVHLDPGFYGADTVIHVNHAFEADPEISRLLRSADFRRALSMGIDRDQVNEVFFLGLATPGSVVVSEESPECPGPEYRNMWSTLDVAKANELLDSLGLDQRDSEGYRLRSDGGGRLRIECQACAAAFLPWAKHAEMLAEHWKTNLGLQVDVKEYERTLFFTRVVNNEHHLSLWTNGGTEMLYLYPMHALPVGAETQIGDPIAKWYATGGKEGIEPTEPELKEALSLLAKGAGMKLDDRNKNAQEIWKIIVDQQISIGTCGLSPAFLGCRIASNKLGNVPARQANAQHMRTPSSCRPTCLYFKA